MTINYLDKFLKIIMSPKVFSYTLIWLIILVFFGTIAQKDIGLYASQMKYFSSFYFLFLGFIPFPGGRLVLLLMTVNLFSSMFKRNLWQLKKIGIIIVHLGGLLLLAGGGLTAYFSSEGNMVIAEGESSNYVDDYHNMELAFVNNSLKDSLEYTVVDESLLYEGSRFQIFDKGPEIYIISNIDPFNIHQAAYVLRSCYEDFPDGTIHIISVDDELTINNEHLVVKSNNHYFIGSDNGLFSLLINKNTPEKIIQLNINQKSDCTTFAAKNVFVPAACHLSRGGTMEILGKEIENFKTHKEELNSRPTKWAQENKNQLGSNHIERAFKDYNGQTYWLTFNIKSVLQINDDNFPSWLSLALGYGANKMLSPYNEGDNRERQYFFSFDIDLNKIKTRSKTLNNILHTFGFLKFPMPTLELRSNQIYFNPIYY